MKLDNLFFWIGKNVARHPIAVIFIALFTISIILSGLMFLEVEVLYYILIDIDKSSKTLGSPG